MLFALIMLVALVMVLLVYLLPLPAFLKAILVVIALILDILAFSTKFYSYIFVPFLQMKDNTVVLNDEEAFMVAPTENAIVVRQGNDIYASAFVKIPIYKSATEMTEEDRTELSKMFSKMVALSRNPVRFTSQLYIIDKDSYMNEIMDRMSVAEEQYQGLEASSVGSKNIAQKADSERIRGEVTMWHNLFDNVSKVKSHVLTAFAMVTVPGDAEEEAINVVLQQADELASGMSAVLGVTAYVIEGKELLEYIEVEHMIPPQTIGEQMKEKSIAEGI